MSFPEIHNNLIKLQELKNTSFPIQHQVQVERINAIMVKILIQNSCDTKLSIAFVIIMLLVHACFDFQSWRPIRQFKEELSINSPFPGIMDYSLQDSSGFFDVCHQKKISHPESDEWYNAMSKVLECNHETAQKKKTQCIQVKRFIYKPYHIRPDKPSQILSDPHLKQVKATTLLDGLDQYYSSGIQNTYL